MAGRSIGLMDVREVLRHLQTTTNLSAIQRATGLNRRTLMRYRAWAAEQGLLTGPLPPLEELRQYDALVLLTGFGAVMRRGAEHFTPDAAGFYHMPGITAEAARRIIEAGLALLAIDSPTIERQTQGNPLRMTGDVHPLLLGHSPPVFILEAIAGDRIASLVGLVPTEGMLEVIPRRANAKGADAAPTRAFLSFYRGPDNRRLLERLIATVTPKFLYG